MSVGLNFSPEDLGRIQKVLSPFTSLSPATDYESARWQAQDCTVILYKSGKLVLQGKNEEKMKAFLLERLRGKASWEVGVDETGRSEKTGPFVIVGLLADKDELREVRDSKKTGDIALKERIVGEKEIARITFSLSPRFIDFLRNQGLSLNRMETEAINAIADYFSSLGLDFSVTVDGLPLNKDARKQVKFLPKADDLNPVVGGASVAARKTREDSPNQSERTTWRKKE